MIFLPRCVNNVIKKQVKIMHDIAVIIPKYGLVGGAEQFASELTEKITYQADYKIDVLANRWQNPSSAINFRKVPVVSFPKFLTTISFAYFVQRQIKQHNYSIVHSHERIFKADIFTMHGIPHRYWVNHIRRKHLSLFDITTAWVENKLVQEGNCKKFISVSNMAKNIFLQEYPMSEEKFAVIHPGIHLKDYANIDRKIARAEARKKYGISDNEPVLIFVSMNFEIKGLDAILEALGRLKARGSSFRLLIAGKGNVGKYTRLATKAGIAEKVIFTGKLNKDSLIRHYLAADIYIMLSAFDTFGMVVLEAMAAGLPVIISSTVGAKDLVREGENGFVINDTSDSEAVAETIKKLLDEKTRGGMSCAALATAEQNTWDKTTAKYLRLYHEIFAMRQDRKGSR